MEKDFFSPLEYSTQLLFAKSRLLLKNTIPAKAMAEIGKNGWYGCTSKHAQSKVRSLLLFNMAVMKQSTAHKINY